jgi:hypothetical protein
MLVLGTHPLSALEPCTAGHMFRSGDTTRADLLRHSAALAR